ncbi:heme utilization cystosolic carrier protein HutX [Fusobacterium sp.]|uniref:heme utilization cystosolic carrier protein HutX n=1 Tax=Fusobacterium sp. TaxID=68766 RepID=UPI00260C5AF9|nr:heme utilization cystosolic carrier protein HutX [Fusobacterium sp.]
MKNRIEEILKNDSKTPLSKIAQELGVSLVEVLREAPTVRKYDVEKIDDLFEVLRSWDKVLMLVMTPNLILEIKDKFPKGFYGHGFFNFHDPESSVGGHLTITAIKEIFLVTDTMFNRKSCSIRFFGEDGKEIFAVYVPRDEKKELIKECLESFESL